MSAYDFLVSLGARGFSLFAREERLMVAPGIALTDDERVAPWRHELALLAILRLRETAAAREHPDAPGAVPCDPALLAAWREAERRSEVPLTFDGRLRQQRK